MLEQCDFGGRVPYFNDTTLKSEFQLVKYITRMTSPASKSKCKRKELYDLLVDQFTQKIPVVNSTIYIILYL